MVSSRPPYPPPLSPFLSSPPPLSPFLSSPHPFLASCRHPKKGVGVTTGRARKGWGDDRKGPFLASCRHPHPFPPSCHHPPPPPCNVQLADEIILISIISLIFIFAHAPVLSNLIYKKKTCAVTLTGKRPPNRDPERQRTELVQDTKALMVQDTKTGDE